MFAASPPHGAIGDGEGGGQNRQSYSAEDVEYYFNYSGILAERGSYDTMEDLIDGIILKPTSAWRICDSSDCILLVHCNYT